MPDEQGNTEAGQETETPLHAYKEDEEQVKGDVDALKSGDADQMSRDRREEEDEPQLPKH